MSMFVVDCESDGPIAPKYSLVCFGSVLVEPSLTKTFYGQTKPISDLWIPEALAVSGFTREQHLSFDDPKEVMLDFKDYIEATTKGAPILISDNNQYDGGWINWYFHYYLGKNPFGFSSRRIGDLYSGLTKDSRSAWKHLRKTKHDHHPVNDAKGNAEAILEMRKMGLKIDLS